MTKPTSSRPQQASAAPQALEVEPLAAAQHYKFMADFERATRDQLAQRCLLLQSELMKAQARIEELERIQATADAADADKVN